MSIAEMLSVTAYLRIAPAAIRKSEAPMLTGGAETGDPSATRYRAAGTPKLLARPSPDRNLRQDGLLEVPSVAGTFCDPGAREFPADLLSPRLPPRADQ
jgi:hypothetical protein